MAADPTLIPELVATLKGAGAAGVIVLGGLAAWWMWLHRPLPKAPAAPAATAGSREDVVLEHLRALREESRGLREEVARLQQLHDRDAEGIPNAYHRRQLDRAMDALVEAIEDNTTAVERVLLERKVGG